MAVRILTWNCRGIVSKIRQGALIEIIRQERPKILFLSETLCDDSQHETVRVAIGFDHCLSKPKGEGCRGLALFWLDEAEVRVHNYSVRHIDAYIGRSGSPQEWRFTGFYGFPRLEHHHLSWELLCQLQNQSTLPWLVSGDFNAITAQREKCGGDPKPWPQIQAFRQVLQDCDLIDMGFQGKNFTWSDSHTKERLDRSVWTVTLRNLFPEARTFHLPPHRSDHRPLLVDMCTASEDSRRPSRKQFRFEQMWASHEECAGVIAKAWHSPLDGNFVDQAVYRIKNVATELTDWSKNTFNFLQTERKVIRARLDALLAAPYDPAHHEEKKELDTKLQTLLTMEEQRWSQRARETWLKEGDRNTGYFFRKASNRKHRSRISKLKNSRGEEVTTLEGIEKTVTDYFHAIFTSQNNNQQALEIILNAITPKVTYEMNTKLLEPYSDKEIKEALDHMHASKAPGPDGMSPFFYQKNLGTLGHDLCNSVRQMLSEHHLLAVVNFTHVTLIPKVKNPVDMGDLRPIALCQVIYRVASKVLANRLKSILHEVISPLQSAFVPGRLISDNTLVATEVAHQMHINSRVGDGNFALKLDISKAYDRLEWNFMEQVLIKLGFDVNWVSMVMSTLTSVRYSYVINGEVRGYVSPSRGIRQGDPLSPYLFILCAEGLSALISSYVQAGKLQGLKLAPSAPLLHHLLFADDSYFFGEATEGECQHIRNILYTYELASGQMINLQKSSVVFSKNVKRPQRRALAGILGVTQVAVHDRYLGLPTRPGRSKIETFEYLRDRLSKKLIGWRSKLLSGAGKEVLIKACAQSIPNYAMNCYLLPDTIITDLHQLCAEFWWGDTPEKSKVHWRSWNRLCVPKARGGMGFKNLRWHNLAMLAKQGWRLMHNPNSLAAKLYKAVYFPQTDFLHAEQGRHPSFSWRSILAARPLILRGMCWNIGTGTAVNIWADPWIPMNQNRLPMTPKLIDAPEFVSELMNVERTGWDVEKLGIIFTQADVEAIKKIRLMPHGQQDQLKWYPVKQGHLTTQSAYDIARDIAMEEDGEIVIPPADLKPLWSAIWREKVPPKVALCIWRAASNILPVRTRLTTKGYTGTEECLFCPGTRETNFHMFTQCSHMLQALKEAEVNIVPVSGIERFDMWLLFQCATLQRVQRDKLFMIIWSMWRNRDSQLWENKCSHPNDMALRSVIWLNEFQKHNPYPGKNKTSRGWRKPPRGTVKCNVSGLIKYPSKVASFAYVVRDDLGNIVECCSSTVATVDSKLHIEAIAFQQAVLKAEIRVHGPVQFETNSALLVRLIKQPPTTNSPTDIILQYLNQKLVDSDVYQIDFVPRAGNAAAFKLAFHGLSSFSSDSWYQHAPIHIRDALLNDCNRY